METTTNPEAKMNRYTATITVRIAYDAATSHEAEMVARELEDAVTLPCPRGRNAELLNTSQRVIARPENH